MPTTTTTPSGGSTKSVTIANFAFSPQNVSISVGDTVRWTNTDDATHRIGPSGGSAWTGNLGNGGSGTEAFNSVGTFNYICQIHPSMTGSVTATP